MEREIERGRLRAERELGRLVSIVGRALEDAAREQEHAPPPPPRRRRGASGRQSAAGEGQVMVTLGA